MKYKNIHKKSYPKKSLQYKKNSKNIGEKTIQNRYNSYELVQFTKIKKNSTFEESNLITKFKSPLLINKINFKLFKTSKKVINYSLSLLFIAVLGNYFVTN